MDIPFFTEDLDIIQKLGTFPNTDNALSDVALKREFDTGANKIKDWLNNTLIPGLAALPTKALKVTVSGSKEEGYTADQGVAQILTAVEAGQGCVCLLDGLRLPLVLTENGTVRFAAVVDEVSYQVEIGPEGVRVNETALDNRTFYLTVVGSEETGYTCAYQLNHILSAFQQGPVACRCDRLILPLVKLDEARADFFGLELSTQKYIRVSFTASGCKVVRGEYSSSVNGGGVYVGEEEPTDPSVMVWIDPDGGKYGVDPVGRTPNMTLDVGMDADGRLYVDAYNKATVDAALGAYIADVDALIGGEG
jgi:hypothetical protein